MADKLGMFAKLEVPGIPRQAAPTISIIIPTLNHLDDFLRPCLESIRKYTDLSVCEVIVVANGCTDGTEDHVRSLGQPFRVLSFKKPLGFPAAVNAGIEAASGEFVVLLNNDTALLEQEKNAWIDWLLQPFRMDPSVGMTGPVKFHWTCGETRRQAMAFWCTMIPRALFLGEIGPLDEVFSPGTGEDGDFSIKVEEAGYRLVQVPIDGSSEFGRGIPNQIFPIEHKGSGTFGEKDHSAIIQRNAKILVDRYGKASEIDAVYRQIRKHPCDVNLLFPAFRTYARQCRHITEFGVRDVVTTWAFLAARPMRVVSYDVYRSPNIDGVTRVARAEGVDFEFKNEDVLSAKIEQTDLLYIDTKHTFTQLKAELLRHASNVRRFILIHDTESYGDKGEDGGPGEILAIEEFLKSNPFWELREHYAFSNGLTVLERVSGQLSALLPPISLPRKVSTSIIIPTCGKDWGNVLKKCLSAVSEYTDFADKEIIVVANGAPREALEYLELFKITEFNSFNLTILVYYEPIGYIRAVNAGIQVAQGDLVVTLDDDSFLIPQEKDRWIRLLSEPFSDLSVGAAGPFSTEYPDLGQVLHSGCTMYRRKMLLWLGLFDEAFNPGYMGDEDLSIRIRKAGYALVEVPVGQVKKYVDGIFQLQFPVIHMGNVNTMPKHTTELPLVEKNRKLLYERHSMSQTQPKGLACPSAEGHPGPTGEPGRPKVSIIIPTYKNNFRTDEHGVTHNLLKRNLETLALYTDLVTRDVEVIVVCNGCVDGQEEHVKSLGEPFRVLSFPDAIGYTKATNEGIKASRGEYLLFLNDDVELLHQPKNQWLDWLLEPFFADPKMGVTGPLQLHDNYSDHDVIIGFCLMTKKSVMQEVMKETGGLLDEIYTPGGGEDIDLCARMRVAGYKVRQVPKEGKLGYSNTNTGLFMIWHVNNQTFKDIPEYTRWYVKRNGLINLRRYNKNIKLNLGSGGIEYPGYLSVDLYDERANIIMDVTKLDFEPGSVSEMLAIHVFEHLNPYHCLDILKSWRRILKPGGRLVMEMPDIEQLCRRFVEAGKEDPKNPTGIRYGILNAVYGSVNTTGKGAPSEITSPHLYGWWPQALWDHLTNAGFTDIKFGPEMFPHPESNLHVEAINPGTPMEAAAPVPGVTKRMKDLWKPPPGPPVSFGEDTTYKKAMDFLCGCDKVEDWGCGSGYAKKFMKEGVYVGVDGSRSEACQVHTELAEYRSVTEGILLRHVIDHNPDWRLILENAVASFTRKLVLIVCTPLSEETKRIATNWDDIPDLSFRREDILEFFEGLDVREETLRTATQYGVEHVFYVSRR